MPDGTGSCSDLGKGTETAMMHKTRVEHWWNGWDQAALTLEDDLRTGDILCLHPLQAVVGRVDGDTVHTAL